MTTLPEEAVNAAASNVEFPIRGMNGLRAALTAAAPHLASVRLNVDALAQEIRRVDGNHDKGAAALAEALIPFLSALEPSGCKTCNGHGIIGGMYRVGDGDVDGWEKPCPDCEPSPQAQSSELSRRLEEFLKENEDCFFDCEIQTVKDAIRALSSPDHADAGKVEGDGCIGEWKEIEVSHPLKGRRQTPAYFPATGETCEVSGPNCDDDDGFTWGKTTVLWQNQLFVLYGNDGYWPVLHKHEHVLFRPLPSAPASEGAE